MKENDENRLLQNLVTLNDIYYKDTYICWHQYSVLLKSVNNGTARY